jgi:MFS family permease
MTRTSRWPYFLAAIINGFFLGVLFVWSYFREELGILFPTWRASDLSLIFSVHNVFIFISVFAAGFLLKKFSNRALIFAAAAALLIGFGLFPYLPLDRPNAALIMATVLFGVVSASAIGVASSAGYALYTRWAPDHPGKVIGSMSLALSIAPIILGALCSVLVPVAGALQTIRWVGVIAAALLFATLPLAKPPGPDAKLPPAPVRVENPDQKEFTPAEMLRTPVFWIMLVFNTVIRASGLMIIDFGGSIAIHFGLAALLGMLYSPANGAANVIGGVLVDKLSTARVIFICGGTLLLGAILLLAGNEADSGALVMAGLLLGGLSYGCGTVHSTASIRIIFGQKHYARNWSYIQLSILLAAFCGYMAGNLIDKQSGNYQGVFTLILICSLAAIACGFGLMVFLKRKKQSAGS